MRDQIEFLKRALNRAPSAGPFGYYHVANGLIYAQNEQMQAVAPIALDVNFSAPGAELEAALSRMVSDPSVHCENHILTIKAGRLRATVPCIEMEPPPVYGGGVEWLPFPGGLLDAIKTAIPFIIGNGLGWANAIRLQDGRITVINNRCGIDIAVPGLLCAPSLLTQETGEFILAHEGIEAYSVKPGTAFLFRWGDGRSLQAQLIDQQMPPAVEQIFASAGRETPIEITADFRAAFEDAAAIAETSIEIRSNSICVDRGTSKVTIEIETSLPEGHASFWETKVLKPMVDTATAWNPGAYPRPALFKGPAMYGLVCGIKA